MIDEALQEMKEVEELENTLHGDRSVNIAKTFKVIGTLFMICNPPKPQEAKDYLQRAQSIFEQRGLQKLLKEVKEKIKLINWQMKQGGPLVSQGADADNIIEESAYDSNNEGPLNP
mmetsp:Transcript_36183/g.47535  ORF Transcript_36183/g.47535 Transcript_36183/m.47535 type:complete len:116 (+) Transcript_36183:147-494(+)